MRRSCALALFLIFASVSARAQDWQRVFQLPSSTMSCGYFFNASEGLIGTGNYLGGSIASIYYTTNGGARWIRAELAIPIKALTPNFDPKAVWRANFYRIEGIKEPRTYMAWQATGTPQPNFHVPSAFGSLRFEAAK
jgi:hypothetical protein